MQQGIETVGDDADLQEVCDTERHLLYVACPRARDYLLVTGVDPVSEFLDDFMKGASLTERAALGDVWEASPRNNAPAAFLRGPGRPRKVPLEGFDVTDAQKVRLPHEISQ